jgi:hypothetical protein
LNPTKESAIGPGGLKIGKIVSQKDRKRVFEALRMAHQAGNHPYQYKKESEPIPAFHGGTYRRPVALN